MKRIFKLLILITISNITLITSGSDEMTIKKYPKLHSFEDKMKTGEHLNVAFLGGSITWGSCASDQSKTSYRALVSKFLEETYGEAHIKFHDAAIGGTPSKLGVFRMDRDVLPHKPDLTFIEFAVNDAGDTTDSLETMEGIIRKLKNSNPDMAIFIIVVGSGKHGEYGTPRHLEHIELANYYNLPYADVCGPVKEAIKAGKVNTDIILEDGCHPTDAGYKIYADIIIDDFKKSLGKTGEVKPYPLPMTENRFEMAKMLELSKLDNLGGWKQGKVSLLGTWFDHQPSRWVNSVIIPEKDGAEISFELECSGIGIYYEIFQDGKNIIMDVNGKEYDISTHMNQHYNRLGWTFCEMFTKSEKRKVTLKAPEGNVKAAYMLYTK